MEHEPSRELVEVIISGPGWAGLVDSGAPSHKEGHAEGAATLTEVMSWVWAHAAVMTWWFPLCAHSTFCSIPPPLYFLGSFINTFTQTIDKASLCTQRSCTTHFCPSQCVGGQQDLHRQMHERLLSSEGAVIRSTGFGAERANK